MAELARRVIAGEQDFDLALREFIDTFDGLAEGHSAAIAEPPARLPPLEDAYLAATAEHLARMHGLPVPDWAETRGLDLQRPYFAGGLESLKALLHVESPTAFRRRMLFVSGNALFRPHAANSQTGGRGQEPQSVGRSPWQPI